MHFAAQHSTAYKTDKPSILWLGAVYSVHSVNALNNVIKSRYRLLHSRLFYSSGHKQIFINVQYLWNTEPNKNHIIYLSTSTSNWRFSKIALFRFFLNLPWIYTYSMQAYSFRRTISIAISFVSTLIYNSFPFYSNWIPISLWYWLSCLLPNRWQGKSSQTHQNCSNFQFEHIIWNLHTVNYLLFPLFFPCILSIVL